MDLISRYYNKLFAKRDELVREGQKYWSPKFDSLMSEIAVRNTLIYVSNGAPIDVWTDRSGYKIPKFPLTEEDEIEEIGQEVDKQQKQEVTKFVPPVIVKKEIVTNSNGLGQFIARNKGG